MESNTEKKEYEETIKRLFVLLKRVCQERDEARDQLQFLLRNFQPCAPAETSSSTILLPQLGHPKRQAFLKYKTMPSMKSTEVSDMSPKAFSNCSHDLSLASLQSNEKHSSMCFSQTRIAESSNLALPKQPSHQNKLGKIKADIGASRDNVADDIASLVINKLAWGKPLPQKGRLLQTVTEAGPLLQTLLVAPTPRWKNPPPLSSPLFPPSGTRDNASTINDDKANVNTNGVIPTSLSLAFPRGPSQVSSASSSGLSVKNEPVSYADMESNRMHYHILTGKKRKFL